MLLAEEPTRAPQGITLGAGGTPGPGSATSTPTLGLSTRSIRTLLASSTAGRQGSLQQPRGARLQAGVPWRGVFTTGCPLTVARRAQQRMGR